MERIEEMKRIAKDVQKNFRMFYLAGGTVLMFKYNHRISEDLDFLSEKEFSFLKLSSKLKKILKVEKEEKFTDNIDFFIEGIKTSFIFFPFKNIKPLEDYYGIKIASDYDIFLNKIYSAGRRIETKDVIDFAFLYERHKWGREKVKKDFEVKFQGQSFEIYLGAVLSIEDYPDLDGKSIEILEDLKSKWKI